MEEMKEFDELEFMLATEDEWVDKLKVKVVEDEGIGFLEQKKGKRFQASHLVFTVHKENWDFENEMERWDMENVLRYVIGQWEVAPETGKKHFQGYAQMKKRCTSRKAFQKALGAGKCWCEKARGSSEECQKYCSKTGYVGKGNRIEGTEVLEWGKAIKKKGERTDLAEVQNMLEAGESVRSIAKQKFGTWVKAYKAIDRYKQMVDKEKAITFRKLNIEVHYGKAGSNKSRTVEELAVKQGGGYYRPVINNQGQMWFSNYEGEKNLILDDFYGQVKFSYMLRLLDGYRLEVETKGGQTYALWENIYITSNVHPGKWYTSYLKIPEDSMKGMQRRITKIVHYHAEPAMSGWVKEENVGEKKRKNPFSMKGGLLGCKRRRIGGKNHSKYVAF